MNIFIMQENKKWIVKKSKKGNTIRRFASEQEAIKFCLKAYITKGAKIFIETFNNKYRSINYFDYLKIREEIEKTHSPK